MLRVCGVSKIRKKPRRAAGSLRTPARYKLFSTIFFLSRLLNVLTTFKRAENSADFHDDDDHFKTRFLLY